MKLILAQFKSKNIKKISRSEYKEMLDQGIKFKNWSLYEPEKSPKKTYYIVLDDRGNAMLNKVVV